jgi:ABC-type transporter Mla maintaining outer membrane lipid asymmetry ATPase subunit MlaF
MSAAIDIDALALRDGDGRDLVTGLRLGVERAGAAVLAGPVEAASAVLRALVGLEAPASGAARLLGAEVRALPVRDAEALLARVGYVPRAGALVSNLPLRDNLVLPLRWHRRADGPEPWALAEAAAARFGLAELPAAIPPLAGVATRRRVALARAILLAPEVLLLDDPTEDLDAADADELCDRLAAAARELGAAVLAASNDFRVSAALRARTVHLSARSTA